MDKIDNKLLAIRNENEDGDIEVEISPTITTDDKKNQIIEQRLTDVKMELDSVDNEINKLTCNADMIDYAVSAGCGVLAGILDIIFVGEFEIPSFNQPISSDKSNKILTNFANKEGYKGSDYNEAYSYLNQKYNAGGSASHPSIFGLILSITTALTTGNLFSAIFNGVISWGIGASMVGIAKGSGLPSSISSLINSNTLKVKPNKMAKFNNIVSDAINGKNKQGLALNLTTELNFLAHLGKQALVVGINEVLVRAFYFLRNLFKEIKENNIRSISELKYVNWETVIPFKNRTIVRMLTVSETVMLTIDLADATIQGLIKSLGNAGAFFGHFFLRINYINIARCAISFTNDIMMGNRLDKRRNERIQLMSEYSNLTNAKLFYKQSDMWKKAENVGIVLEDTYKKALAAKSIYIDSIDDMKNDLKSISDDIDSAEKKNPGLKKNILGILD